MRYCVLMIAALLSMGVLNTWGRGTEFGKGTKRTTVTARGDSIMGYYTEALQRAALNKERGLDGATVLSPYYFRLLGPATLYNSALTEVMGMEDETSVDPELARLAAMNRMLAKAYANRPELFTQTESALKAATPLRRDLEGEKTDEAVQLAAKVETQELVIDIEPVSPEVQKPNFWTIKGNGSMQFTQNYFSDNWYQGGEKNYSMLAAMTIDANYDNKRGLQWDNRFEAQLGFQTSETDEYHKFKATNNLLRATSKLGYKATKHWNYASQLQLQSQPYMSYDNKGNVTADFVSPLYIRTSVGMDYKFKTKRLDGSLYLAPLSWNVTYVDRSALRSRYNVKEGHRVKHDWGPNVDLKFTYKICDNISWQSRLYWFSNLELTRMEWENTVNFTVNRYVSAKLFMYPRFDDSTIKYRNEHGDYWMFKEWLSLGLNYDF